MLLAVFNVYSTFAYSYLLLLQNTKYGNKKFWTLELVVFVVAKIKITDMINKQSAFVLLRFELGKFGDVCECKILVSVSDSRSYLVLLHSYLLLLLLLLIET